MKKRLLAAGVVASSVAVGSVEAVLGPPSPLWLMVIAGFALSAFPFAVAVVKRRFDIFEPVYLFAVSFAVLFVIRPSVDIANGLPDLLGYSIRSSYAAALAIGLVGSLSFYIGYYLGPGKRLGRMLPSVTGQWIVGSLYAFIGAVLLICGALVVVFIAANGGASFVGSLLAGRNSISQAALRSSSGYLYSAPLWVAPLGVLLLVLSNRLRSGRGVAGVILIFLALLTSLGAGDRSWILPIVSAAVLGSYLQRQRRPSIALATVGLTILFVFGITIPREFRDPANSGLSLAGASAVALTNPAADFQQFFERGDTAMVDDLAVAIRFIPSQVDYQFGRTYLEALTRPFPRSLWPDKPRPADTILMASIWPGFQQAGVGFAFSLFAEPYLNFGWPGVFIFALAFGVIWRALYSWLVSAAENRTVIAIYALSWPFIFVYMRGGLGVDYHRQAICILPVIAAAVIAGVRTTRPVVMGRGPSVAAPVAGLTVPHQ